MAKDSPKTTEKKQSALREAYSKFKANNGSERKVVDDLLEQIVEKLEPSE